MVDIQQNREFIEKKESEDRSGYLVQASTSLPHIQVNMGEDKAGVFCLGLSQET